MQSGFAADEVDLHNSTTSHLGTALKQRREDNGFELLVRTLEPIKLPCFDFDQLGKCCWWHYQHCRIGRKKLYSLFKPKDKCQEEFRQKDIFRGQTNTLSNLRLFVQKQFSIDTGYICRTSPPKATSTGVLRWWCRCARGPAAPQRCVGGAGAPPPHPGTPTIAISFRSSRTTTHHQSFFLPQSFTLLPCYTT